jgi:hypothetical protein
MSTLASTSGQKRSCNECKIEYKLRAVFATIENRERDNTIRKAAKQEN